ncbi:MAG: LacI family DNA-binding transcriptional regulator [Pseudomonadales bacterium]
MSKKKAAEKTVVTDMQHLADLAGVSRATVSRALSDSPLVNDKTKAKIRKLAAKHGYQVNEQARNFRLKTTKIIAVAFMLDTASEQHMSDPFFLEMLGGIADCLAEHDYDLLLAHAPITDVLDLQNSRLYRQSDGVIFVGQFDQHEQLNELAKRGIPIVAWGAPVANKEYCLVGGDNERGGFIATQHLLEKGRKRIAFFGDNKPPEIKLRYSGYKKALRKAGLKADEQLQFNVPFELNHARDAVTEIVRSKVTFDAAVCGSDVMALSTIAALSENGLRVPEDIAVVGYDDIGLAAHSSPPLTTIRQNIPLAGRLLAESLLKLIDGQKVADTTIEGELVARQSSGK